MRRILACVALSVLLALLIAWSAEAAGFRHTGGSAPQNFPTVKILVRPDLMMAEYFPAPIGLLDSYFTRHRGTPKCRRSACRRFDSIG